MIPQAAAHHVLAPAQLIISQLWRLFIDFDLVHFGDINERHVWVFVRETFFFLIEDRWHEGEQDTSKCVFGCRRPSMA